ncbi:MAG: response regulator [Magnetococcus sp. WYHC-3]
MIVPASLPPPLGGRILVVDDNPAHLDLLKEILDPAGHAVTLVTQGVMALETLREMLPDLVLLDVHMPRMDGLEVLRRMGELSGLEGRIPPVLLLCDAADLQDRGRLFEAGAADLLARPHHAHEVRARVAAHLALFRERARRDSSRDRTGEGLCPSLLVEELVAHTGHGLMGLDAEGRCEFCNPAAARILGWDDARRVLGRRALGEILAVEPPLGEKDWFSAALGGTPWSGETRRLISAAGTPLFCDGCIRPLPAQGKARGVVLAFRDAAERKARERRLLSAQQLAERSSQEKSAFLATMSHEIRTPMNAILGITNLLEEPGLSDTSRDQYHRVLRRNARVLLNLLNNVYDLTQIEKGALEAVVAPFDPAELVAEVAETFQSLQGDDDVHIEVEADAALKGLWGGDRARLEQVLTNLVSNAVKFTDRGEVRLQMRLREERDNEVLAEFAVSDTGRGIAEADMKRIFEVFQQSGDGRARRERGAGLGLAISRELIVLLGGEIRVRSTPGKGSRFDFSVPLQRLGPRSESSDAHEEEDRERQIRVLKGKRILLVEDAEDNIFLIQAFLKRAGVHMSIAPNGAVALEMVREGRFDLILMDLQMPVMDGFEATRRIRAWEQVERSLPTPIIALTAHTLVQDADRARNAGCSDFLAKPVTKAEFFKKLVQHLR